VGGLGHGSRLMRVFQKSGAVSRESSPPDPLSHLPPAQSPGEGESVLLGGRGQELDRQSFR
jgi:hypothetical protein